MDNSLDKAESRGQVWRGWKCLGYVCDQLPIFVCLWSLLPPCQAHTVGWTAALVGSDLGQGKTVFWMVLIHGGTQWSSW